MVQLVDLGLDSLERRFRFGTFAQKHNAFHHIVVIYDAAIGAMNGLPVPPEPDFRSLRDGCYVAHANRRAILSLDHGPFDVDIGIHQTNGPHVHLLQAGLDEAAAGVDIVVGQLLLHLADA